MVAGPGSAFAANCTAVQTSFVACAECQIADQETLLEYFNTLPSLTGGVALVTANLRTEENIYLNSTQEQKIASGTVFIVPVTYPAGQYSAPRVPGESELLLQFSGAADCACAPGVRHRRGAGDNRATPK